MAAPARFGRLLLAVGLVLGAVVSTRAQPVSEPEAPIKSMGQPPLWKPYGTVFYGRDRSGESSRSLGAASLGIYKDVLLSSAGGGLSSEGWIGGSGSGLEGGLRAFADARGLGLKAGLDYDFRRKDVSFILSWSVPLRRGGILGRGSQLRVDWLPDRGNSWNFGVFIPFEPHMGRTRPRDTEVDLPRAPRPPSEPARDPRIAAALAEVQKAARWVQLLSYVFWDDHREDRIKSLQRTREEILQFKALLAQRDARHPNGHDLATEVGVLHDELARAFGLAAGSNEAAARGEAVAVLARRAMLEDVVLPYDRLFGQYKRNDSLLGFGIKARARFADAVRGESGLARERQAAVRDVFEGYLQALEQSRAISLNHQDGEARGVFLPLQLAMRPEEHDTQAEIDALVERAVGRPFTTGNFFYYLSAQRFQSELTHTLHETEDYHVLWVHDYCGVDLSKKNVDELGLEQTVDGYLAALTDRVRDYDRTGKLPVFMILLDARYYEAKKGRIFMDLLENPLRHRGRFPPAMRERVARAQEALRQAVRDSRRLREVAAARGDDGVRKLVKVHVSITNPIDFSFRTSRIVGYLPIAPDHAIRDHRKIAFRDLTEDDPSRGEAIFTGVSVGEQYASATWEDRTLLASGPAVLYAKEAVRYYLHQNGFRPDEIPPPLRARPLPPDYAEKVRALEAAGATARALQVHNERGFGRKDATLANAIFYTLLPPDSVLIVPNPLWTSMGWAARLVGAALRGCHVFVIAPARANAPSGGFLQLSRSREVLSRFLEVQRLLGPEIEARGGRLRVGLYTREAGTSDFGGRLREVGKGYRRYPFLKDVFPLAPELYAVLDRIPDEVSADDTDQGLAKDAVARKPQMHRKTQLFATRASLRALAADPGVAELMRAQLEGRATPDPEGLAIPGPHAFGLVTPFIEAARALPEELRRRSIYYMTAGSLNNDARGMVLDGEVLYVVSGEWSLWAYADFFFLLGSATWLETPEQFDALLPPYSFIKRRLGRWFRKAV